MDNHTTHYDSGINGTKVYICQKVNPFYDRKHNNDKWFTCGILADEKDAQMWVNQDKENRKYLEYTIGIVNNKY